MPKASHLCSTMHPAGIYATPTGSYNTYKMPGEHTPMGCRYDGISYLMDFCKKEDLR